MKKKKDTKCWQCKKRKAKWKCYCGFEMCAWCSDKGDFCPADEMIDHVVEKIISNK